MDTTELIDQGGRWPEAERRGPLDIRFPTIFIIYERGLSMKWQITRAYWKAALVLGSIAAFVVASGAALKW